MKNLKAKELRERYERRVRESAEKKNTTISIAEQNFEAEVKMIHKEVYNDSKES